MLTGELKSKIDRIWDAFWSGGISNPLEVIEQITYLLFLKRLDILQTREENMAARLGEPMRRNLFPAELDGLGHDGHREFIADVQTEGWWIDVTLPMLEEMRRRLAPLVPFVEKGKRNPLYTDFTDTLGEATEVALAGFGGSQRLRAVSVVRPVSSSRSTRVRSRSRSFVATGRSPSPISSSWSVCWSTAALPPMKTSNELSRRRAASGSSCGS